MRRSLLPLLLLALLHPGCSGDPPWNILVVTFDTTRADHIGCYGNDRGATPARFLRGATPVLDRLAAEGTLFEQARVPVPITLPSHASLMTGKVPLAHGVRDNGLFVLGDEQTTLAEILGDAGYRTAAAVGAFPLTAQFGIGQGFELFDDHLTSRYEDVYGDRVFPKERLFFDERPAARVNDAVLPWLEQHHQEPFFLWLHYFDPHHPHQPPPPFDQLFAHDLYAAEIAYADESLGTLLGHLQRLGVSDRTLVVFTSDHGEGLGEHRESTHSLLAYDSTLHVPLIVKVPGGAAGRRVKQRVSVVDVLPTLLELLGLRVPEKIQGRSLVPLLAETGSGAAGAAPFPAEPLYAETLSPRLIRGWGELRALFAGDYKYIHGPRPELFDLANDPRELHDLAAERPAVAKELRSKLELYIATHAVTGLDSSVAVDEDTASRLAALGYLAAAGGAVGAIDEVLRGDGDPPQDHAGTVSALSQAKQLLFKDKPLAARELIHGLLATDSDNPEYLELLANAELKLGRNDQALEILERLADPGSGHHQPARMLQTVAAILLGKGDVEAAYTRYRDAEAIAETAQGQYRLAKIHEQRGEVEDQRRFLERALELEPGFVPARVNLGIWYAQQGQPEEAELHLLQAMNDHPYHERTYFNYGVLLVETGRAEEAISYFERAVELRADYLQARSVLIELHLDLGDRASALVHYKQLDARAPQSTEVRRARQLLEIEP